MARIKETFGAANVLATPQPLVRIAARVAIPLLTPPTAPTAKATAPGGGASGRATSRVLDAGDLAAAAGGRGQGSQGGDGGLGGAAARGAGGGAGGAEVVEIGGGLVGREKAALDLTAEVKQQMYAEDMCINFCQWATKGAVRLIESNARLPWASPQVPAPSYRASGQSCLGRRHPISDN